MMAQRTIMLLSMVFVVVCTIMDFLEPIAIYGLVDNGSESAFDPLDPSKSQLACEVIQGGTYYTDNGEGHCIIGFP